MDLQRSTTSTSAAPGSSYQFPYQDLFNLLKSNGIKISSEKDLQTPDIEIFRSILLEARKNQGKLLEK